MTGSEALRRRAPAWVGAGVAAGFLLLLWASSAGPVRVFSPSGRTHTPDPRPTPVEGSAPPPETPTLEEATRGVDRTLDLSWLGDLISWTLFLGFLAAAALVVRWSWRRRDLPSRPTRVDFDVVPVDQVAEALARDAHVSRAAVAEGDPRTGIVRCWLVLQESVAHAGVRLRPSETSAEFTVRVLHALDLDPRAIERLARLYREARFSRHELGEDARSAAGEALDILHADLRATGRLP